MMETIGKEHLEYIRYQAKSRFDKVRATWIEAGSWALPYSTKWMQSQVEGERNNRHIIDPTHILSLRSCVAGFLEGNTSATRPWFKNMSSNPDANEVIENKAWLQLFTKRNERTLAVSNFYHAAGGVYHHYNVYNTGAYWVDELPEGRLYFHVLIPGSYFIMNNHMGEAVVMVREMSMNVKSLVEYYGKKKPNGDRDWSNISDNVKKMYMDANYSQVIDFVSVCLRNPSFDINEPAVMYNKEWITYTYELGGSRGQYYHDGQEFGTNGIDPMDKLQKGKFLEIDARSRKPFIVAASDRNSNFEYGEKGPTTDSLGLIKSLNKKAIAKDQAIEQMLRPALQGPAGLNKSYVTSAPNSYVPLDPTSYATGKGLKSIFEINPGIGALLQDQSDMRRQVDKFYYADFLLFLSNNPKTRTAAEANAIVQEQQTVIGPNLQSLNFTHNLPVTDYIMSYNLENDPHLPPPPEGLQGEFIRTEFVSVFAQAQRAADLPSIERYMAMISQVGQLNPAIWDKANVDKFADLIDDRLYLPVGLNNPQALVDAKRQQAQAMAQRQQMLEQQLPAVAGAAKDLGLGAGQGKA